MRERTRKMAEAMLKDAEEEDVDEAPPKIVVHEIPEVVQDLLQVIASPGHVRRAKVLRERRWLAGN
jgi:hypothetical protein